MQRTLPTPLLPSHSPSRGNQLQTTQPHSSAAGRQSLQFHASRTICHLWRHKMADDDAVKATSDDAASCKK